MLRTGYPWMSEEVAEYVNIAPSGQLLLRILGGKQKAYANIFKVSIAATF